MELFLDQLENVDDKSSSMYSWRFYLLETIAQVKCFALCNDLPNGREIIRRTFEYVRMMRYLTL